ncbi:MAG TPA: hypothetical protein VIY49_14420 [Bryobacteraceae bacterium]
MSFSAEEGTRYSDEQLYALALYISSLEPPPNPNKFDEHARRVTSSSNGRVAAHARWTDGFSDERAVQRLKPGCIGRRYGTAEACPDT